MSDTIIQENILEEKTILENDKGLEKEYLSCRQPGASEEESNNWITIEENAHAHFRALIEGEQSPGMAIRLHIEGFNGPAPEVVIAFCPLGQEYRDDKVIEDRGIRFFIAALAYPVLWQARISYEETPMGGQLVVHAPHLKAQRPFPSAAAPLKERIEWVLDTEVRPQLALHRGEVSVAEITEDNRVVLAFGGGCKGCRMVDYTMKYGVEQKIKQACPEVLGVVDATNHQGAENPYYG